MITVVKCQIQLVAHIKRPPLPFDSSLSPIFIFHSSLPLPLFLCHQLVFSVFTLLMLVEGLRANAVNVVLRLSRCQHVFFSCSRALKPSHGQICQVWGQVPYRIQKKKSPTKKRCTTWSKWARSLPAKCKPRHIQRQLMKNSFPHSLTNERRWCI